MGKHKLSYTHSLTHSRIDCR